MVTVLSFLIGTKKPTLTVYGTRGGNDWPERLQHMAPSRWHFRLRKSWASLSARATCTSHRDEFQARSWKKRSNAKAILISYNQTSENWGPETRFLLEAIIKALIFKSSRYSIMRTHNRLHPIPDYQPDSSLLDYLIFHTWIHNYLMEYLTAIRPQIKADYRVISFFSQ